jgi:hypothetical protein
VISCGIYPLKPKIILLLLLLFFTGNEASAQLSVKNQFEFTHWYDYNRRIVENWSDALYQYRFFQTGARFEINRPPDPFIFPQDSLLKNYELTFAFTEVHFKKLNVRAGNFYTMFGRGLSLRTFEDRNLRVDNNLLGAKAELTLDRLAFKALVGQMRDKYNRRQDRLYGADVEVQPFTFLRFGGNLLQTDSPESGRGIGALRSDLNFSWGTFYAEFAKPQGVFPWSQYIGFTAGTGAFTLLMEYKDYNHLGFKSSYGTEYNAPPALTREHSFTLLNRHPHALNSNDEKGTQIEVTWTPASACDVTFNHSLTRSHADIALFEEYYAEIHHLLFDDHLETRLAAAWNSDFTTNTENITTIVDPQVTLTSRDLIHLSWQHQHTKNRFDLSEYDTELLQFEYSRSPYGSFALVGEYTNQNQLINVEMERHVWFYGQISLNLAKNQELSLLYGSRQAGFVCVGGICRYEPEFRGLEIKVVNRF